MGGPGNGGPESEWGPWEWRTPGMADPGCGGPEPKINPIIYLIQTDEETRV